MKPVVGILAIQGSVREHSETLKKIAKPIEVKDKADFQNIEALIIPGGESTTIIKLLKKYSLDKEIIELCEQGKPIYGTCAGAILLANKILEYEQGTLRLIDIEIERNAYGRQYASFEEEVNIEGIGNFNAIFIRAPVIRKITDSIKVLAYHNSHPVMVRENNVLLTTFHPELANDTRVHEYFLGMIK